MGTGSWIFSILGTLFILGLIIWIVSPNSRSQSGRDSTGQPPGEILDRRLANGELTTKDYNQVSEALNDAPATTSNWQPPKPAGVPG